MRELQIFKNEEFGEVRALNIKGDAWIVGKDLVERLGYKINDKNIPSTYIKKFCDEEDYMNIDKNSLPYQEGVIDYKVLGQRGGYLVNESGMYSLILRSELPSSKKFKRWVTSEVLPGIRKDGGYIKTNENMSDDEIMARALMLAQNTINRKDEIIHNQKKTIDTIVSTNITYEEFDKQVRKLVNMVVSETSSNYPNAWNSLYDYLNIKLGMNLKLRQTNKIKRVNNEKLKNGKKESKLSSLKTKYTMLKMIKDSEYEEVLRIVKCWCVDLGININDFNKLNL